MDFAAGLCPPSSRLRKPWFSDSSTEHLRSSSAHCQHKQLHCNIELQATKSVIYILQLVTNCESLQHYEQQWAHSCEEAMLSTRSLYVLFFLLFCTTNTGMPLHSRLSTSLFWTTATTSAAFFHNHSISHWSKPVRFLAQNFWWHQITREWLIKHGSTSPPTQYRLYGRRFLQVRRPNQPYQSNEGLMSQLK